MNNKKEHRILFEPNGCLTQRAIGMFIDGKLSEAEINQVRGHTKDCPLCADAIEGAALLPSSKVYNSALDKMRNSPWRQSLNRQNKQRRLFIGIYATAASLALLFGLYYILQMRDVLNSKKQIFEQPEISMAAEISDTTRHEDILKTETEKDEATFGAKAEKPELRKKRFEFSAPIVVESDLQAEEMPEAVMDEQISYNKRAEVAEMEKAIPDEIAVSNSMGEVAESSLGYADDKDAAAEPATTKSDKRRLSFESKKEKAAAGDYYMAKAAPAFDRSEVDNYKKYLADSLKTVLPDSVLQQTVIIGFRITTGGKIENVKLLSGKLPRALNQRVVKLVESSPEWVPVMVGEVTEAMNEQVEIKQNK